MATRFKSFLDDIPLHLEIVDDSGSKAFDESEYPNTDGAEYTSLGMHARKFNLRAWFINDGYDDYQRFIDLVSAPDTVHNLVHPALGLMVGVVPSWSARHDIRKATVVVDFEFNEELLGDFDAQLTPLIAPQVEELFISAQQASVGLFGESLVDEYGPDAQPLVSNSIDPSLSIAAQFVNLPYTIRAFVAAVDLVLIDIRSFCSQVAQPANTIVAGIEYATTVPGIVMQEIARAVDRYTALLNSSANAPAATLQSFYSGLIVLRNSAGLFADAVDSCVAQAGALLAAVLFKTDDENRAKAALVDDSPVWNDKGEYVGGTVERPPVMTVQDLERSLAIVREAIERSLVADRSQTQLSDMAAALLRHVNAIKIEREKVATIEVPEPLPLLLLCHARGLGYRAADRVLALNDHISNPSFTSGQVDIYVR